MTWISACSSKPHPISLHPVWAFLMFSFLSTSNSCLGMNSYGAYRYVLTNAVLLSVFQLLYWDSFWANSYSSTCLNRIAYCSDGLTWLYCLSYLSTLTPYASFCFMNCGAPNLWHKLTCSVCGVSFSFMLHFCTLVTCEYSRSGMGAFTFQCTRSWLSYVSWSLCVQQIDSSSCPWFWSLCGMRVFGVFIMRLCDACRWEIGFHVVSFWALILLQRVFSSWVSWTWWCALNFQEAKVFPVHTTKVVVWRFNCRVSTVVKSENNTNMYSDMLPNLKLLFLKWLF